MVASNAGSGPRYAPVDPTLPPPWRALVDGNTGYIYYWNTETNVTQYEKPLPAPPPPLPAGPPPVAASSAGPNVAVGPSTTSSGTTDHQTAGSSEGRSSADGSVPSNALMSPHGSGGNVHGSGGNVHGMTGAIAHPGGGGSSYANSSGSGHGTAGGVTVPGNIYGNSSNAPVHARGHITGSGPRSGSGISGGTVHMNASDKSFGSSGRHTPGVSGGPMGGVPGGNVHVSAVRSANVSAQPKLAALPVPQRQQGIGGMHMPLQPRQMGHISSSGPRASALPGMGPASAYKRVSSDHMNSGPDIHKKPRMQGFSDHPLTMDVDTYRRQHEITVMGGDNVPPPFMTFDAANFPREIARELLTAGFSAPTPIQAQSWPIALQSRDIVAIAKTGSGKTLGYLLPAFVHLSSIRVNSQFGPVVLVLAPTRELATQIHDEAVKFGRSSRISCTCVYGGAPKAQQLRELDRGSDIVIATPGRLNDFLEMRKVSLRQVSYLVLDEADRMLDMGFEPQIRKIVNEIPPRRQTLMYTATWPKEVRKIASDLLVNAVQVNIGNSDELTANKAITQNVEIVSVVEKQRRLEQILRSQEQGSKILIFCSTKKMCDQLARSLGRGFGASAIHGDKSQTERDFVLAQFKTGRSPILVATDVAARGLDIKDIRVVINFDFPTGVEDYVHRIGRTGRAGATGVAFTFFSEQDSKYAKELIKVLEGANQKVPSELRNLAGKSFHPKGRPGRWDGMGGRDGGYNMYRGGRGDGRGDGFGGRGSWGPPGGQADRRDRNFNRFGDQERFLDRNAFHDKFSDDRNQGRDGRKFGAHERGRSYSRSPDKSRGRSYSHSRSPDRYSDDHYRRFPYQKSHSYRSKSPYRNSSPYNSKSPYRSVSPRSPYQSRSKSPYRSVSSRSPYQGRRKSPYRSVSPRSPYQGRSPYTHSRPPIASNNPQRLQQPSFQSTEPKFAADSKGCQAPDPAFGATADSKALIATSDSSPLGPATVTGTHTEIEEFVQPVQQEKMSVEYIDATGKESNLVDKDGGL